MGSSESKILGVERHEEISFKADEIIKRINDKGLNSDEVTCTRLASLSREWLLNNYTNDELEGASYIVGIDDNSDAANVAKSEACSKIVSFYKKKIKVLNTIKTDSEVCGSLARKGDYDKLKTLTDLVIESKNMKELTRYSKDVHNHLGRMNAHCKHVKVPISSSSLASPSPKTGIAPKYKYKYVASFDFAKTYNTTMSVKKGDIVLSDGISRDGYLWVTSASDSDSASGYIPESYLTLYQRL